MRITSLFFCLFAALLVQNASAQIRPLDSDIDESYYYTDHFEIVIDKPVNDVWPVLIELGSWMAGLEEANPSSPVGVEGEVFRLYGDFHMEVVKVIPEKMLLLVNLPNSQQGEDTQGIAMITTQEVEGKTLVSMFMSRIYFWSEPGQNTLREQRESSDHSAQRTKLYKDNFLSRLKQLVEKQK